MLSSEENSFGQGLLSEDAGDEEAEASMPAVTLTATTDNGVIVTVEAPEGAFPEGVTMKVSDTDSDAFAETVSADFEQYDETYTVVDALSLEISFCDADSNEIEPEADVTVTLGNVDLATSSDGCSADYALIYHVADDGSYEWVADETPGEASYTFTASDFSEYGVVNVGVEYGVSVASVSNNAGNASHIDIGVSASASVTVNGVVYSNSSIGLTSEDFTSANVTITAVQGSTELKGSTDSSDWNRTGNSGNYTYTITDSDVDFVYNLSDLSTSTGSSNVNQVRIGGCFPVGQKGDSTQVNYTLELKKTVTLTAEDGSGKTLEVPVVLTATFGYWDSNNDCPPVIQSATSWSNGNFIQGSGLDFLLSGSGSSTSTLVNVVKMVQDSKGNLISEASGQSFGYSLTTSGSTETGTITVGGDGVGMVTLDVDNNSIADVSETSYPETITTSDGTYKYVEAYTSIDDTTNTATIVNVYDVIETTTNINVTKVWSDDDYDGYRPDDITVTLLANGEEVTDDNGSIITLTLSDANNWKGTFTDLPLYDGAGEAIAYTIAENAVAGYTSDISGDATSGFTITNTLKTGSLTLNKAVKADNSIDTSDYTFTFYVKGNNGELDKVTSVSDGINNYTVTDGVATVTVSADKSVTLVGLPVGNYTVYESDDNTVAANGHTWTVSGDNNKTVTVEADDAASATITNTIADSKTIAVTKTWVDANNDYGTRPESDGSEFTVTLTRLVYDDSTETYSVYTNDDDTVVSYTTEGTWTEKDNTWYIEISDVAAYDSDGNAIVYGVTETSLSEYALDECNLSCTNIAGTTYYLLTPATDNTNVELTNALSGQEPELVKTETYAGDKEATLDDETGYYDAVSVGDTITYKLDWYNGTANEATVTITDPLDAGVDFVSASGGGAYDEATHTATWTIEADPFESGTVTLIVRVNENAKSLSSGEATATVENDASMIVSGIENTYTTGVVVNPLEDDDPTAPTKAISEDSAAGYTNEPTTSEDGTTVEYDTVAVGDLITYTIGYYNNYNEASTVIIVDALDEGVDFVSASDGGSYDATTHTVTWTIGADPFESGTVTLVVQVNENAKAVEEGEGTATVENSAKVQIGTDNEVATEIVVNPIDPDDPNDPSKAVDANSASGLDGGAVQVGDKITYVIGYYNHSNSMATVTITDVLEDGLTFVSASDGGTLGSDGKTVTWTIEDVAAFTTGTVTLTVSVNENALTTLETTGEAAVENQATVAVAGNEASTNIVTNPVDDDPTDPVKSVDIDADGVYEDGGVAVDAGDEITYAIDYYNHTSGAAIVTITDALDDNVTFVSASDDGVYDATTHTVTWTLEVEAYTVGTVTLTVSVNEDAQTVGSVSNTASVFVGNDAAVDTNTVTNPVNPAEEEEIAASEETSDDTSTQASDSALPKTGDSTMLMVPGLAMLAIAAAGTMIVVSVKNRRRRN